MHCGLAYTVVILHGCEFNPNKTSGVFTYLLFLVAILISVIQGTVLGCLFLLTRRVGH